MAFVSADLLEFDGWRVRGPGLPVRSESTILDAFFGKAKAGGPCVEVSMYATHMDEPAPTQEAAATADLVLLLRVVGMMPGVYRRTQLGTLLALEVEEVLHGDLELGVRYAFVPAGRVRAAGRCVDARHGLWNSDWSIGERLFFAGKVQASVPSLLDVAPGRMVPVEADTVSFLVDSRARTRQSVTLEEVRRALGE